MPILITPQLKEMYKQHAINLFYGRNGTIQNLDLAKLLFEQILSWDPDHIEASYMLGKYYQFGYGGKRDFSHANLYYQIAWRKGDLRALRQIFIMLNPQLTTAEQWYRAGQGFYSGSGSASEQNYLFSYVCYDQALQLDANHVQAHYAVGSMLFKGIGLVVNHPLAAKHFSAAAQHGHDESLKALLEIENPPTTTSQEWYDLGCDYYSGTNDKVIDYRRARLCF